MTTNETRQVAQAYFEAWSTRKGPEALVDLMAPDFTFRSGEMTIEGRDAFLAGGGWPDRAVTALVTEAYDGETGIQIYDAKNGDVTVRIADHLTVRNERIVSADVVCDGNQFQAFMSAG